MEVYLNYGSVTNNAGRTFYVTLKVTEDGYWVQYRPNDWDKTTAQAVSSSTPIHLAISRYMPE